MQRFTSQTLRGFMSRFRPSLLQGAPLNAFARRQLHQLAQQPQVSRFLSFQGARFQQYRSFHSQGAKQFSVSGRNPPNAFLDTIYKLFIRSGPRYVTIIIIAAIVGEMYTNYLSDCVWASANKGKLFEEVIPKRFPNMPPGTEVEEEAAAEEASDDEASEETSEEAPAEEAEAGGDAESSEKDAGEADEAPKAADEEDASATGAATATEKPREKEAAEKQKKQQEKESDAAEEEHSDDK